MLQDKAKSVLYELLRIIMYPNTMVIRLLSRIVYSGRRKLIVHVGCGPKYVRGWVNIDINPLRKKDLWLDARNGLPFPTNRVDAIIDDHLIEHLREHEIISFLLEMPKARGADSDRVSRCRTGDT